MTIAVFLSIWSTTKSSTDLDIYFRGAALDVLRKDEHVKRVEIYTPEPGDVPLMDDVPSPSLILQVDMDQAEQARALTESEEFKRHLLNRDKIDPGMEELKLEITEVRNFPLAGQQVAPPRTAPLSFVVRYYGPVADACEFADFYQRNHPPILANFPGLCNVLCYLPLGWNESGKVDDSRLIIGNEVVFEDLAALKNALDSDVIKEAKKDSSQFQDFGYSTHHAMHRELVYQR